MALAVMLATDEDALTCDFAEYYHVYDLQGLSPQYAAILAYGLREDSRIMLAMTDQKIRTDTQLFATMVDSLRWLCWSKTKDGAKGRNRPESILETMLNGPKKKDIIGFRTPEDFEKARMKLIGDTQWQQEQK